MQQTRRSRSAACSRMLHAMNRRALICGLEALATGLSSYARAQSPRSNAPSWSPWKEIPSIAVVSAEDDSRVPAVWEAVDFWNGQFSRLGSSFKLGAIVHVVGMFPVEDLYLSRDSAPAPPASIQRTNCDMIVVLSEADINSFAICWRIHRKVLIAINSLRRYSLTSPEGARNVRHGLGRDWIRYNDETDVQARSLWRPRSEERTSGHVPFRSRATAPTWRRSCGRHRRRDCRY